MKTALVVGGGLAGISAALSLAKYGVKVQLLEARRRLGGRTGSFTQPNSTESIDYCQHVGMGCCTNLRQLIDWLGQRDQWETHRNLHFYGPDGSYQRLSSLPVLPAPLHLAGWLWRWPGLTFADRISITRGMLAIRKLVINRETDSRSAQTWLQEHHQTPAAIDRFWRTIIVSALGEELAQVNLSSVAKVLQDGFLNHRDAYHLLVPKRPLGELFGTLAEEKLTEQGVNVQLQTPVQRIVHSSDGFFSVETDKLGLLNADAIVIAVPWYRVSDLVESTEYESLMKVAENAAQMISSPISGIHTWWDRSWLDTPHAAIVGRLCQWVFPKHSGEVGQDKSEAGQYYQIVVSASRQLPRGNSSELIRLVQEDLGAVFPKVRTAKLLRMQAVTDPLAVFSIGVQSSQLRPKTHVSGTNIWLSGDWTQTGWPATMEGAILSGWTATESILASWGRPVRISASPLA